MSIFFAIFPIHEHVPAATAKSSSLEYTMDQFKQYLETRGAPLCKSESHLCYYALPYVPDPKNHASFKDLFTETWIRELEERLLKFLGQSLSGQEGAPRIVKLLDGLVCIVRLL